MWEKDRVRGEREYDRDEEGNTEEKQRKEGTTKTRERYTTRQETNIPKK